MTGKPGKGRKTTFLPFNADNGVIHARPFLPFMFKPSEPHTPSRQERRKESVGSCSLSNKSASKTIISRPSSTSSL